MPGFELGDGVTLRPLAPEDARELFAAVDANRARLREWLAWVDRTPSVAEIETFIAGVVERRARGEGDAWAVMRGGRIRGVIGLDVVPASRRAEIGYWLTSEEEGRGTMGCATERVVRHGFEQEGLHRIGIRAATGNARSRAIPERLGFRHEGTMREDELVAGRFVSHEVYALLRPEWAE